MSSSALTVLTLTWPWPKIDPYVGSPVQIQDPKVIGFEVQYRKGLGNWISLGRVFTNSASVEDVVDANYSGRVASVSVFGSTSDWTEATISVSNTGRSLNSSNRTTQDLRNRAVPDSGETLIQVAGYYQANDGGAGTYYADLRDTTSLDDGGSVIKTAAGVRMKLVTGLQAIQAAKFGFVGSASIGTATPDYTANLEKALAYASQRTAGGFSIDLIIDPGAYKITKTVYIPAGVNLVCNGILFNYLTNSIDPVIEGLDGSSCSRLAVNAQGKNGIRWSSNSYLENVTISNIGVYGIKIENAINVTMSNIEALTGTKPIWILNSSYLSYTGMNLSIPVVIEKTGPYIPASIVDVDRGAARAWLAFTANATAVTILDSYNIAYMVFGSPGIYGVGFIVPFKTNNYVMVGGGQFDAGGIDVNVPVFGFTRSPLNQSRRTDYCEVSVRVIQNTATNFPALHNTLAFFGS
jgi:hypothetical protein